MGYIILILISIISLHKWIYWKFNALAYIKYIYEHTKELTKEEHLENLKFVIQHSIKDLFN